MRSVLLIFIVFVGQFFVGCAAKGPKFQTIQKPSQGKSLLYIYRKSAFAGGGVYYDVHITDNNGQDTKIGTLRNGTYLEAVLNPGVITVWAKTESTTSLETQLKPDEIKCVRGSIGMGFLIGRPKLELVDYGTCEAEISETNLSID
jgi:hypothetical protein